MGLAGITASGDDGSGYEIREQLIRGMYPVLSFVRRIAYWHRAISIWVYRHHQVLGIQPHVR